MSTTTLDPTTTTHAESTQYRLTFARIMKSEWIKFRSLRSSWLTLLGAISTMFLLALVIGYNVAKNFSGLAPEDAAPSGVLQGQIFAQLLIGVLGVLVVSGEYSTGMIRSTLAAVPKRTPVLLAKAVVFGAIAFVSMALTSLVSFLAAQIFLAHEGHGTALSAPGVWRVILGTGVFLALIGLLGSALAWIFRSTPAAITTLMGALLVLPIILVLLPWSWSKTAIKYLPSEAGASFISSLEVPEALSVGTGLAVLVGWVVVGLFTAGVLLRRRDS